MSGRAARVAQPRLAPQRSATSWQKDPQGRRERVLAAAARLFAERGYGSVTTGQIAAEAGVAEGNVFHYFGSKQGLLREVGSRWGREFASAMFDGIEPAAGRAGIAAMVGRAFAFVAASPSGFRLFLLSDESPGPTLRQANREVVTAAIQDVLRRWSALGVVEVGDPSIVATLLFGLVESALRGCFAEGHGQDQTERMHRYTREVVTAMVRLLEPDVAPR